MNLEAYIEQSYACYDQVQMWAENHKCACTYRCKLIRPDDRAWFAYHRGQNLKQIDVAKYVSKFLIYGAKMLEKCVKNQKKNFVHCPFLQSQAK